MEITLAKTAGFCFGVDRAVKLVEEEAKSGQKVCTLGEIIHNRSVVESFSEKGVEVIGREEEAKGKDSVVIIRSHGVGKSVYEYFEKNEIEYKDATCPYVRKIQRIVEEEEGKGKEVIIVGDENHPEVIGIKGHCKRTGIVVSDEKKLVEILQKLVKNGIKDVSMVVQTTYEKELWLKCVENVKKVYTNAEIFDTICKATSVRQEEAIKMSKTSDLMVVIGSKGSSNTKKLKEVCEKHTRVIQVEDEKELPIELLKSAKKIGVTAGASAPAYIIKEVLRTMSEVNKNIVEEEFDFEKALEESFKTINTKDKVMGIITSIAPNEATVDIVGTKYAGFLPMSEITNDPNQKMSDVVKIGEELELVAIRVNDVDGVITLSKKRVDAMTGFDKICKSAGTEEVFKGKVITVTNKAGVVVRALGARVFIPASQTGIGRDGSLETLMDQEVSFRVLEADPEKRRAVGSIRVLLDEKRKEQEAKIWAEIEEGKTYTGKVKSIVPFGVFVDIGGVDGLVPISELSWRRITSPSEVVKTGQELEVVVKTIDREKGKVSLGYKKAADNPWKKLELNYSVGQKIKATISAVASYGAFATILQGVDGLIHISQIANERIGSVAEVLKVGQTVECQITEIDLDKKRVGLSMRALLEPVVEEAAQTESEAVTE